LREDEARRRPGSHGSRFGEAERRHAAIYANRRVPRFERWKIESRLLAGRNPLSEVDVHELRSLGVTHVLDLREKKEWLAPGQLGLDAIEAQERLRLGRRWLPIPDGSAPEPQTLRLAADWLDTVLAARDATAYVHCRAGRERTATVLAAWIGRRDRLDPARSLQRLRRFGYPGQPLRAQVEAVARFLRGGDL